MHLNEGRYLGVCRCAVAMISVKDRYAERKDEDRKMGDILKLKSKATIIINLI
jgi:hypothetical protein